MSDKEKINRASMKRKNEKKENGVQQDEGRNGGRKYIRIKDGAGEQSGPRGAKTDENRMRRCAVPVVLYWAMEKCC